MTSLSIAGSLSRVSPFGKQTSTINWSSVQHFLSQVSIMLSTRANTHQVGVCRVPSRHPIKPYITRKTFCLARKCRVRGHLATALNLVVT
jgi:hypothetical protein